MYVLPWISVVTMGYHMPLMYVLVTNLRVSWHWEPMHRGWHTFSSWFSGRIFGVLLEVLCVAWDSWIWKYKNSKVASIHGYDYTICITQSQIHLFNQHIEPQRVPQSFYQRIMTKTCANPMHKFMGGTRKLITKTYIKWITWYPIVTTDTHGKTYIKCSQIFKDSIR